MPYRTLIATRVGIRTVILVRIPLRYPFFEAVGT